MQTIGHHNDLTSAEKLVLKWLEEGLKKEQGYILVEVPIKLKFKRYNRWPDFMIISPKYGVCIVECKGYYFDEIEEVAGINDIKIKNGFDRYRKQLRDYGYLLQDLLKDFDYINRKKIVAFPRIPAFSPKAQAIRELHDTDDDLSYLFSDDFKIPCTLERLMGSSMQDKIKAKVLDEILFALNPFRVFDHNYGVDHEAKERRLKTFDKTQMNYIERIKSGHYLINGLPGTGKTKMLEAIAQREIIKGKKVLYTCFNKPLAESVEEILGNKNVKTTFKIYHDLVKPYGISFKTDPNWQDRAIPLLVEKDLTPEYDVLLIDEYQDLDDSDYVILLKLLKKDGLLVLAGDQLQNIKGGTESWRSKGINVRGRSMFLSIPYRTEPVIVDFALKFVCQTPALKKIADRYFKECDFSHAYGSFEGLFDKIKFLNHDMSRMNLELHRMAHENPRTEILVVTNYANIKPVYSKTVRFEPYTRVKGLEADIVVLYSLDLFKEAKSRLKLEEKIKALFSALCRSRGTLYIHGTSATGFYEELRELYLECVSERAA